MRTSLLLLTLTLGCASSPAGTAGMQAGGFRYSARSASGQPILAGQHDFEFADDSTVSGTWSIGWLPGADTTLQVGPQIGSGMLAGSRYRGDTLLIQLNPLYADHNVALLAVPSADGYTGRWEWNTMIGTQSSGHFVAVSR